jgi:hypothetical protein
MNRGMYSLFLCFPILDMNVTITSYGYGTESDQGICQGIVVPGPVALNAQRSVSSKYRKALHQTTQRQRSPRPMRRGFRDLEF